MTFTAVAEDTQVVLLDRMTKEQLKEQRARVETLWKKIAKLTVWARIGLADHSKGSPFEPWDDMASEQRREAQRGYELLGRCECLPVALLLREMFGWKVFPARIDEDGKKYLFMRRPPVLPERGNSIRGPFVQLQKKCVSTDTVQS